MSEHAGGDLPPVEWRHFGSDLWAGAAEFGPVGTIEHGRRFTAIDTDGNVLGRSRSLEEAQAMLLRVAEAQSHLESAHSLF
jgi:hypothetical protein